MKSKKSFIAYCDWKSTFDELPDDKAGQLIKHIFSYVSGENPQTDDVLIKAVFANIKNALKRDLEKWEDKSTARSETGRLGGIKSGEARRSKAKQKEANEAIGSKTKQNEHVSVNVTVSDTVNVNDTIKEKMKKETYPLFEKWLEYRKQIKKPVKVEATLKALANKFNTEPVEKIRSVIEMSIQNGWTGLFWDKYENTKQNNNGQVSTADALSQLINRR